jgi:hypothetical protein
MSTNILNVDMDSIMSACQFSSTYYTQIATSLVTGIRVVASPAVATDTSTIAGSSATAASTKNAASGQGLGVLRPIAAASVAIMLEMGILE